MRNWQDIVIIVVLLVTFVLGILGILNLRSSVAPAPSLSVNLEDTTYTDQKEVKITGKTDGGSTVKVNGQEVQVDDSGNFNAIVTLNRGDNSVNIVATKNGKETTVDKKIVLQSKDKSVAGIETGGQPTGEEDLTKSGPAENLMGTFALTSILLCSWYYFKSKKKTNSKYSKFAS